MKQAFYWVSGVLILVVAGFGLLQPKSKTVVAPVPIAETKPADLEADVQVIELKFDKWRNGIRLKIDGGPLKIRLDSNLNPMRAAATGFEHAGVQYVELKLTPEWITIGEIRGPDYDKDLHTIENLENAWRHWAAELKSKRLSAEPSELLEFDKKLQGIFPSIGFVSITQYAITPISSAGDRIAGNSTPIVGSVEASSMMVNDAATVITASDLRPRSLDQVLLRLRKLPKP